MADKLGISQSAYGITYENNSKDGSGLSIYQLQMIAQILKVDYLEFLDVPTENSVNEPNIQYKANPVDLTEYVDRKFFDSTVKMFQDLLRNQNDLISELKNLSKKVAEKF